MSTLCSECGAELKLPGDAANGEILPCPECGLDYVVVVDKSGLVILKELALEGEDWGE